MSISRSAICFDQFLFTVVFSLFVGGCASHQRSPKGDMDVPAVAASKRSYESFRSSLVERLSVLEAAFEVVRSGKDPKTPIVLPISKSDGDRSPYLPTYKASLDFLEVYLVYPIGWIDEEDFDQLVLARTGRGCGQQVEMIELSHLVDLNRSPVLLFAIENLGEGTAATQAEHRTFRYTIAGRDESGTSTRWTPSKTPLDELSTTANEIQSVASNIQMLILVKPRDRVSVGQVLPKDSRLVCKTSSVKVFKADQRKLEFLNAIFRSEAWRNRPLIKDSDKRLSPKKQKEIQAFIKKIRVVLEQKDPVPARPMELFDRLRPPSPN